MLEIVVAPEQVFAATDCGSVVNASWVGSQGGVAVAARNAIWVAAQPSSSPPCCSIAMLAVPPNAVPPGASTNAAGSHSSRIGICHPEPGVSCELGTWPLVIPPTTRSHSVRVVIAGVNAVCESIGPGVLAARARTSVVATPLYSITTRPVQNVSSCGALDVAVTLSAPPLTFAAKNIWIAESSYLALLTNGPG